MDIDLISVLAKVAAPAGLAIGAFLYVMRDIVAKNIFPSLTKERAYRVILIIIIASWSIALTSIGAWVYVTTYQVEPAPSSVIGESDRNLITSALRSLTYVEAEQGPVPFLLRIHCQEGAEEPSSQLMQVARLNLNQIAEAREVLQAVPKGFIIDELESFRQLQLDLAKRAQILPGLANGRSFVVNGVNTSCDLSKQYQELHTRLWPLARKLKEFVEIRESKEF